LVSYGEDDLEKDPAYLPIDKVLDLKTIHPRSTSNLPRFLLKDVASGFDGGTNDPFAGTGIDLPDLIKDVKTHSRRRDRSQRLKPLRFGQGYEDLKGTLESKWTQIVTVPEENVGVYAMGDPSGDSMAGLAVLVYNDGDAVIVNIVGRVSIGKAD